MSVLARRDVLNYSQGQNKYLLRTKGAMGCRTNELIQ